MESQVFYPLTFPVTVGPGCIVVMLTLSAHASRTRVLENILGHIGILIAVVVLCVSVYFCYRYAPRITQKISSQTIHGILQVIAFILLCIGVQIAWLGLRMLIQSVPK